MTSMALRARFLTYRAKTAAFRHSPPGWRLAANGAEMWLDPAHGTDNAFVAGNFAHELRRHIRAHVPGGAVVVDGGAQKGFISLELARAVGPKGHILAFEPDPRSRDILQRNLARNAARQVRVYDCALSDKPGEAEFLLSSQLGWSALGHHPAIDRTLVGKIRVETARFDDVAAEAALERLDFIKLDCQGAEPSILAGMERSLAAFSPDVWLEIDHDGLTGSGSSEAEVTRFFRDAGYTLYLPRLRRVLEIPSGVDYGQLSELPVKLDGDYDALAVRKDGVTDRRLRAR